MTQNHKYQTKTGKNKNLIYLAAGLIIIIVLLVILKSAGVIGESNEIEVETDTAKRRTIIETITASGKLMPEKEVAISADVSGEIIELNVKEGQRVEKGDLLLRIKPDEYVSSLQDARAAYNSSMASLENSKANYAKMKALFKQSEKSYERYKQLKEKDAVSETDFERIETEYLTANANMESAKKGVETAKYSIVRANANVAKAEENLKKTSIYAPIDGIITVLNNELGERVVGTGLMQGSVILKVADLSVMVVKVDVNENDIIRLEIGDTADIEVDAFLNEKFNGVVTEIANSSKQETNLTEQITTFEVKIRLIEKSYKHLLKKDKVISTPFRPGMSAMVDIRTKAAENVVCVPILAVTTRSLKDIRGKDNEDEKEENSNNKVEDDPSLKKEVVFVVDKGKAIQTPVTIGIQDDYYIEITDGLEEGTQVVSGPYSVVSRILRDKQNIKEKKNND